MVEGCLHKPRRAQTPGRWGCSEQLRTRMNRGRDSISAEDTRTRGLVAVAGARMDVLKSALSWSPVGASLNSGARGSNCTTYALTQNLSARSGIDGRRSLAQGLLCTAAQGSKDTGVCCCNELVKLHGRCVEEVEDGLGVRVRRCQCLSTAKGKRAVGRSVLSDKARQSRRLS